MFTSWRRWMFDLRPTVRLRYPAPRRARLLLETLEDRTLPAITASLVGQTLAVTADAASDAVLLKSSEATLQVIDQHSGAVAGSYGAGSFSSLTVRAAGNIILAADTCIAAGSVSLDGHHIGLAGAIVADGGTVTIRSLGTTVFAPTAAIHAAGGSVQINPGGGGTSSVKMFAGALIDASGGSVELSGAALDVNAGAVHGQHILFDPTNIQFRNDVGETGTSGFAGDLTEAFTDDPGATSVFHTNGSGVLASGVPSGATIHFQATNTIQVLTDFNLHTATNAFGVSLVLQANGDVQVSGMITADGGGTVTLEADTNGDNTGVLTLSAGGVTTANGAVNLFGHNVVLSGAATINAGAGDVTFADPNPGNFIAVSEVNVIPFSVNNAELNQVNTTGSIVFGSPQMQGDINLIKDEVIDQGTKNFRFVTAGNIAIGAFNFFANNLTLQAGGLIRLPGGGSLNAAGTLTAIANTGITMNVTGAQTLIAHNNGQGDVDIINPFGPLTANNVTNANGSVTLQALGGDLTVGNISASGPGANVTLTTTQNGKIIISGHIAATNQVVYQPSAANVVNNGGDVTTGKPPDGGGGGGGNPPPVPTKVAVHMFASGADAGGGPNVLVFDSDSRQVLFNFFPFDPRFTGGVRVAIGDVNADGVGDIICAAGPGGGPNISVFSGKDLALLFSFFAFDQNFTGGCYVSAGDVNGDGFADIIIGADAGGGPNVTVFSGRDNAHTRLMSFFPYDPRFTGGVRVGAGDVSGQGYDDVITGAGPGGGPDVTIFDGKTGARLTSFFAYDQRFNSGIYVSGADVNNDGHADVICGAGAGGGPNVTVFSGADSSRLLSFFPYDPAFTGGVRVGGVARNASDHDILSVAGPGGGPDVRIFHDANGDAQLIDQFFAYDIHFSGGLYVTGGR